MLFTLPIAIIGYAVIANIDSPRVQYGMTFLMATGQYASVPCILVWMSNNSAGHYKRATTSALQLAIANCGGFVASMLPDSYPRFPPRLINGSIQLSQQGWPTVPSGTYYYPWLTCLCLVHVRMKLLLLGIILTFAGFCSMSFTARKSIAINATASMINTQGTTTIAIPSSRWCCDHAIYILFARNIMKI